MTVRGQSIRYVKEQLKSIVFHFINNPITYAYVMIILRLEDSSLDSSINVYYIRYIRKEFIKS